MFKPFRQPYALLLFTLICSCNNEDKITLGDLYLSDEIRVENASIFLEGIQSVKDAIFLPEQNAYFLLGGDDSRDIFTCLLDSELNVTQVERYGGSLQDFAYDLLQMDEETYFIVGGTRNNTIGSNDFMLIRIMPNGQETWTKTYGTRNSDPVSGGTIINDSEVLLYGQTLKINGQVPNNLNALSVFVNQIGDTIATYQNNFDASSRIAAIQQTSEGKFAVLYTVGESFGNPDLLFSVVDDLTALNTEDIIGVAPPLLANAEIIEKDDELFAFSSRINEDNNSDIVLRRTNLSGELSSELQINSDCSESPSTHYFSNDGVIFIGGRVYRDRVSNALLCKVNANNTVQWCNEYDLGGSDRIDALLSFTEEELVVIAAKGVSGQIGTDEFIFKVSTDDGRLLE